MSTRSNRKLTVIMVAFIALFTLALAMFTVTSLASPVGPTYPAAPAFYRFGAEVQLSPDGAGSRHMPAVAYNYNHGEYLVVWHNTWPGGERDIYARRVSRTGEVLSWFAVSAGANNRAQPAVAYNGLSDEYLVVWMYEASPDVYEIWGRRIQWNAPGSSAEFRIIQWANRSFWSPRVAWNSLHDEYLVTWNAMDTTTSFPPGAPSDIAGYRVSADGVVQNPGFPLILTTYSSPHQMDMLYNPAMDEYFLAFVVVHTQATTGNDIYGLRVSWEGQSLNPPGLIHIAEMANDQDAPAVALNHTNHYMVVWQHAYSASDHDIYAREYNADGSPVGSYFTIASWTEDTTAPDVHGNGTSWLTVWQMDLGGGGVAVEGFYFGQTAPTYFFDIANYAFWENENPALAADGTGFLIAYEGDSSTTDRHIYARPWWPAALYLPLVRR